MRISRAGWAAAAALGGIVLAACGGQPSGLRAVYQLHMDFFSHESGLATVIDPQMFVATPGAPAAVGPQMIRHVAGVMPVPRDDPDATPLLDADGRALGVSLGEWKRAAGSVTISCSQGAATARSALTGLIPDGLYSVFVVHLAVTGAGRFTPFGDAAGTDDSFTASSHGTATTTDTVAGCLTPQEAVVVIWHSDGRTHGSTPGTLGVTWHNSVITPVP